MYLLGWQQYVVCPTRVLCFWVGTSYALIVRLRGPLYLFLNFPDCLL